MIIEQLKKDPERMKILRNIIAQLHQINGFAAFMELGAMKLYAAPIKGLEDGALKASFHNGYVDMLNDLYYFFERHVKETPDSKPAINFGVIDALVAAGDLSPEEAEALRKTHVS